MNPLGPGLGADFWRDRKTTRARRPGVQPTVAAAGGALLSERPQCTGRRCQGSWPAWSAESTSAHRSAARACSSRSVGSPPRIPQYAASTASSRPAAARTCSALPRSRCRVATVGELPVDEAGDLQRLRVDEEVLRVEVTVHQTGPRSAIKQVLGVGGQVVSSDRTLPRVETGQVVVVHPLGQVRRQAQTARSPGRRRSNVTGLRRRHPAERRGDPPHLRAESTQPLVVQAGHDHVAALPRQVLGHEQAGGVRGAVGSAYLQDLRHGQQPADQAQQRRLDLRRLRRVGGIEDPDHHPLPRDVAEERAPRPPAGQRLQRGQVGHRTTVASTTLGP